MKRVLTKEEIVALIKENDFHAGDFAVKHTHGKDRGKIIRTDVVGMIVKKFYNLANFGELEGFCDIITQGAAAAKDPKKLVERGNYFGALSAELENVAYVWSSMYPELPVPQSVKRRLTDFVTEHFPAEVKMPDFEWDVKSTHNKRLKGGELRNPTADTEEGEEAPDDSEELVVPFLKEFSY